MTESSQSVIPDVAPHLACRYSALEVAALACRSAGASEADIAPRFLPAAARAELPPHLIGRLRQVMASGTPSDITFNPYLTEAQRVALIVLCCRALGAAAEPIATTFGERHRMPIETIGYLARRSNALAVPETHGLVDVLLDPPEGLLRGARELAFRASLGAGSARSVGHIPASLYEHPSDRAALRALREVTGFDTLTRKYSEWFSDRVERIQSVGSKIRVSRAQFPDLHALWLEALERAGLGFEPDLYVDSSGMGALTRGVQRRQVVLGSSLISLLDPKELLFVLGHELGHIRSEHVMYRTLAENLPSILEVAGSATLGLSTLVSMPLRLAILDWYRKSEFTCDRFGLLVCQDLDAAGRALMKLAGTPPAYYRVMNWREFALQAGEVDVQEKLVDKIIGFASVASSTHPWPAVRCSDLVRWVDSGDYERLRTSDPDRMRAAIAQAQQQHAQRPANPPGPSFGPAAGSPLGAGRACSSCGNGLEPGQRFCDACGSKQE